MHVSSFFNLVASCGRTELETVDGRFVRPALRQRLSIPSLIKRDDSCT
jgi:hypothetical protein